MQCPIGLQGSNKATEAGTNGWPSSEAEPGTGVSADMPEVSKEQQTVGAPAKDIWAEMYKVSNTLLQLLFELPATCEAV